MGAPWQPRGPDDLDEEQRARIRRRVLRGVRPHRHGLADRAYDLAGILALPAPHLLRAVVAVAMVVSIVGTATVASADALPEEPLYGVKVASEQVRLALARTPADRAAVELSMAEHRLSEAERLALSGREPDALVATSAYGTHLANAAAELAAVERLDPAGRPVVDQLKQRLAQQQRRAAEVAGHLVADPTTAGGAEVFRTVASFAPAPSSGATVAEGIAQHAASVADQLAAVAERLADAAAEAEEADTDEDEDQAAETDGEDEESRATPRAAASVQPRAAAPTAAAAAQRPDATRGPAATAKPTPKATTKPAAKATADPKKAADAQAARAVAEKAKREAEKSRLAAEKAKEAAKRTAPPKPAPKR